MLFLLLHHADAARFVLRYVAGVSPWHLAAGLLTISRSCCDDARPAAEFQASRHVTTASLGLKHRFQAFLRFCGVCPGPSMMFVGMEEAARKWSEYTNGCVSGAELGILMPRVLHVGKGTEWIP